MVLLSDGECGPSMVCIEALAVGLGIVISSSCTENLDTNKEFITVIPDDKLDDIAYVEKAIEENRKISISMRKEIIEYGRTHFSYDHIVRQYYEYLCTLVG